MPEVRKYNANFFMLGQCRASEMILGKVSVGLGVNIGYAVSTSSSNCGRLAARDSSWSSVIVIGRR